MTRSRRWTCASTTLLALFLVGAMAFAATASALPGRFWGVVPQTTPSLEHMQELKRGGVDSMRVPFDWTGLQPQRNGPIEWSVTDAIVENAAKSGIELLPFATGAPQWAVRSVKVPGGGALRVSAHLPASGSAAGAWKRFLRGAVQRYGPNGSFWAERRGEVPKRPIRVWQIWNEQNFKFFIARPNPAEYGKLVKLSYAAIRGADRGAQVLLGGMFSEPKGCRSKAHKRLRVYCADQFLAEMYEKTPGVKSKFHGIALHPYTATFQELRPKIEDMRQVLSDNRDARKGVWITEMGWSSERPRRTNIFAKGENGQRNQLKGAFSLLRNNQRKWNIKRVYWFSVDDVRGTCNFCDGSGLFGEGGKPKKSWFAYVRFAGGRS